MNKNFWFVVMVVVAVSPWWALRYYWQWMNEAVEDSFYPKVINLVGIITTAITVYGHLYVEPYGFMTTQWQAVTALLALAFGGTSLLIFAFVIGDGVAQLLSSIWFGWAVPATVVLTTIALLLLIDPQLVSWTARVCFFAGVIAPGLLLLDTILYAIGAWEPAEDVEDDALEDGELAP